MLTQQQKLFQDVKGEMKHYMIKKMYKQKNAYIYLREQ